MKRRLPPDDGGELTDVDQEAYPVIHRLRGGLTENRFEEEFGAGLDVLVTRIAQRRAES